jgi:aldehyde:ferredoxin oxidoreductase
VFTPLPLVDEILDKLDASVWDPTKTFIDNSCGSGNFLVRVIAYKIAKGSTAKQALKTTYGVDLMEDNVRHARERILTNAYVAQQYKKQNDDVLPHLDHEEECTIGMSKGYKTFAKKHYTTVIKNIVCHNALTYDYSFDEQNYTNEQLDALEAHLKDLGIEF